MATEQEKKENQQKILEWIRNGFNLTIDDNRNFVDPVMIEEIPSGSDYIVDLNQIFQAIKDYVKNHPHEFRWGERYDPENNVREICHANLNGEERKGINKRPWWSPFVPEKSPRIRMSCLVPGWCLAFSRRLIHQSGNYIHPSGLKEEQFEELKNLVPDTCRFKGCCNFYDFTQKFPGFGDGTQVRGGICNFHRQYPNYQEEPYKVPNLSSNTVTTNPFKITHIEQPFGQDHIYICPQHLIIEGERIQVISIMGEKVRQTNWQVGDTVILTDVQFQGREGATVENGELFVTSEAFGEVKINPSFNDTAYPEVQQKNRELASEEENLALLAEELLEVIEKNEEVVQEAQELGLNLPYFVTTALDFFQEETFQFLDETQPLNSPDNNQINANNEKIRQIKLNFKTNIYRVYNDNKRELDKKKSAGGTTVPKSELEKLKEKVKQKINEVLTDQDNLQYINLTTLDNGKYQNWEQDIEELTTSDEVNSYVETFLTALKEASAKEKEQKKTEKKADTKAINSSGNSPNPNPVTKIIDGDIEKLIGSLSLKESKKAAKNKVEELLKKYNPDLEKLKPLWGKEKNLMTRLEKCSSPKEVALFLKRLEQVIKLQKQGDDKNKNPVSLTWTIPFIIIGLVIIVSLVIIVKFRYKRKKLK